MEIHYTHKAADNIRILPPIVQRRIAQKMRFYAATEKPLHFAKRLANIREGQYRFRVGDYRVFFDVRQDVIFVLKIAKRDKAYE